MKLDEQLNEIDGLSKRTDKYVRQLGRSLMNDKLHMFLSACICLNLIVLIVVVATGWRDFFAE
jgi:hypothetical protein